MTSKYVRNSGKSGIKFNKDFYPTPESLIRKMIARIDWGRADYICEPSAGSGTLLKGIRDNKDRYSRLNIHCIEKDDDLRNMLIGAGEKVVGTDFLNYAGLIQFDTIIMNPPFSNGDSHLLKAIDIMYSGQIVCLLNAETIKNPYTNQRRDLINKLTALDADIEYIEKAFIDGERKTGVEVALITIKIEKEVEDDLLANAEDKAKDFITPEVDGQIKDVAQRDTIEAIVDDYNNRVKIGIQTIQDFYRNYKYIGDHISLSTTPDGQHRYTNGTLTERLRKHANEFIESIRHAYWNKTLSLPQFEKRLTEKKRSEFRESLKKHSDLELTSANVRSFFEKLMGSYEDTLIDAIEDLFDMFTKEYAWNESIHCKNVHYYNGWKSNDAFKVNKKVIVPRFGIECMYGNGWKLGYRDAQKADDVDKVMNYFDGKTKYLRISEAAESVSGTDDMHNLLESEYFKIRFYKKGTTHLTFKSKDIRRRFNIEVGKRKGWLPMDYGHIPLKELTIDKQKIAESFEENVKDYTTNLNQIGIVKKDLLMIEE